MKRRILLWYSFLFATGCQAAANWSQEPPAPSLGLKKIRFAVTDTQDLQKIQKDYGQFRTALEQVLGIPIEFDLVKSYIDTALALSSNQVDLVLTGPAEYVIIRERTKAIPVIAITRPNYRSVIAVKANKGIKSLSQLSKKTIAMRSVGSTSGHLGPTQQLLDAGLNPQSDYSVKMLTYEAGWEALKTGEVDAWAGPLTLYQEFLANDQSSEKEFPLLSLGPFLPNDVFVANSQFNPEQVEILRSRMVASQQQLIQALSATEVNHKFKNSTLIPASDQDYDMIRKVYKALGEN